MSRRTLLERAFAVGLSICGAENFLAACSTAPQTKYPKDAITGWDITETSSSQDWQNILNDEVPTQMIAYAENLRKNGNAQKMNLYYDTGHRLQDPNKRFSSPERVWGKIPHVLVQEYNGTWIQKQYVGQEKSGPLLVIELLQPIQDITVNGIEQHIDKNKLPELLELECNATLASDSHGKNRVAIATNAKIISSPTELQ